MTVRNHQAPPAFFCLSRPFSRRRPSPSRSEIGAEGPRRGDALHGEADQPVERLRQIDVDFAALVRAGALDPEPVGGRIGEGGDVQQRGAAAGLHVEHVAKEVLLPESVLALAPRRVERELLFIGAARLQVVEGVFVGFEAHHLDDLRGAFGFLGRGGPLRPAVLPLRGERDLLDAGEKNGVEVVAHLDEEELASSAVLAVQVDDGVAGGPGAGETVEDEALPPGGLRSEGVMAQVLAGLDVVLVRVGPVEPDLLALVGNRVYAPGLYTRLPRKSPSE